jgi:hypothetical protein
LNGSALWNFCYKPILVNRQTRNFSWSIQTLTLAFWKDSVRED